MSRDQLKRHAQFLTRSSEAFDAGEREEALRIAVSLRVLFHDTKASHSILSQLALKDTLQVTSTLPSIKPPLPGKFRAFGGPFPIGPLAPLVPLEKAPHRELLSGSAWWEQPIYLSQDKLFSRKDVTLAAANQDGGAHVDPSPRDTTRRLIEGEGTYTVKIGDQTTTRELVNSHFLLLRQFAWEVLNSNDFVCATT